MTNVQALSIALISIELAACDTNRVTTGQSTEINGYLVCLFELPKGGCSACGPSEHWRTLAQQQTDRADRTW